MNASISKSTIFAILGIVLLAGLSFSNAQVAHADEYYDVGGYDGGYGDVGGYDGYYDVGGYDYSYGDVGGYDGYYDVGGYDYGDYADVGGYDGYGDVGGYDYDGYQETYDVYSPSYGGGGSYGGTSYGGYSYRPTSIPTYTPTYYAPTYTAPKYTPPAVHTTPSHTSVVNNNTNTNHNVNTATAIASVTNVIQQAPAYVPPVVHQQPYCTISFSNNGASGYYNQAVTLTWSASNAMSAYVSPTIGTVSPFGSMTVYPTSGQIYTMTVYGQGGSATCTTGAFYSQVYTPPVNPTPYVSLSQIPYTGLDMGPMGTAMYWLSLMVFAGAAAYLVLYYQGGMLAFAGSFASRKVVAFETPKVAVASVASTPIASAIKATTSVAARTLTDSMNMVRDAQGTPRLVISRS